MPAGLGYKVLTFRTAHAVRHYFSHVMHAVCFRLLFGHIMFVCPTTQIRNHFPIFPVHNSAYGTVRCVSCLPSSKPFPGNEATHGCRKQSGQTPSVSRSSDSSD